MKHSQTIGILLCLALIYTTTQPFIIIESRHWVITGWNPVGSSFGQSGKFLCFFAALGALLFALADSYAILWLGRALIGRQLDDEVEVSVPSGDKFYLVSKIEFI